MRFGFWISIALAILIAPAFAADDGDFAVPPVVYPKLASHVASVDALVPRGWKIEAKAAGDLNGDGLPDIALTVRDQDSRNVLRKDMPGNIVFFDTNPRILAVLLANAKGGYDLALENHTLVPRMHNLYTTDDPFDAHSLRITHGILDIVFQALRGHTTLRFRDMQGHFLLAGFEEGGASGGEIFATSVDFLSGRAKYQKGDQESDKPFTVRWKSFDRGPLLGVDQIGDATQFYPKVPGPDWKD